MNITACVVPAEVAVAPKGVVEVLRSLGVAAGFCQGSETPDCLVEIVVLGQSTKE